MKTNTKMGLTIIVSMIFLLLFFGQPVNALTTTSGGTPTGVMVRETFTIHQGKYLDYATDLHFTHWQKESWITINGWNVIISDFTSSSSALSTDKHEVYVEASGANIPYCESVEVRATFWLTDWNTKRIKDIKWTKGVDSLKAVPDHGWTVDYPRPDPLNIGYYNHTLTIINDDLTDSLNVTGLAFNATMDYIEDLTTISFPSPQPNFTLGPKETWSIPISTIGSLVGGHIYFQYGLKNATGSVFFNDTADHPVIAAVGGVWVPVDKLGLLAPYIALASTILVATAATAIYVKRVKRRKEK